MILIPSLRYLSWASFAAPPVALKWVMEVTQRTVNLPPRKCLFMRIVKALYKSLIVLK